MVEMTTLVLRTTETLNLQHFLEKEKYAARKNGKLFLQ